MTTYKYGRSPAFELLVSQASLTEYGQGANRVMRDLGSLSKEYL
jgi:hypothetical protein